MRALEQDLTNSEVKRYQHHLMIPEIGHIGQQKLKKARVLVVGAGGLGSPVLLYLAAAGVGTLGVIDDDIVDESNLQRQVLYDTGVVGQKKVAIVARRLSSLNPHIHLATYDERLGVENATELLAHYDLVVDGSDNFGTRYLVNDACVACDKPFVAGSIFKFEGQLSVYNGVRENGTRGASYRCLFPSPPAANEVPACGEIGVIGVLPGIVGTLMANEVLKYVLEIGSPLIEQLLIIDALTLQSRTVSFERNELECRKGMRTSKHYRSMCLSEETMNVKEITPKEFKQWQESGKTFQLVDVREPFERDIAEIGGELIPLGRLSSEVEKIELDKPIVIYCRSGARSEQAAAYLMSEHDVKDVYNLVGGILRYADDVDATLTKY